MKRKPIAPRPAKQLGPMATAAQKRPANYDQLRLYEQWAIDQELGINDWDGDPSK